MIHSPVLAPFAIHINSVGSCPFVVINLLIICLFHLTLKARTYLMHLVPLVWVGWF